MTEGATSFAMQEPAISLVLCTVDDTGEIRRVLDSFVAQSFRNFEVVVVDQNDHDDLSVVLADYATRLQLTHVRSKRGLSKSRNVGIGNARAQIIGFPDDDCWYEPEFLARMACLFNEHWDSIGVTCLCLDRDGRPAVGGGSRRSVDVTKRNAWSHGVSATMFLRRSAFDLVGGFDEELGLGAETPYQSGEETDLLLRLTATGQRIVYRPELVVRHPKSSAKGRRARARALSYGIGMGRVLQCHAYTRWQVLEHIAKPVLGAIVAGCTFQLELARVRWARAVGRYRGYFMSRHDIRPRHVSAAQFSWSIRHVDERDSDRPRRMA